jgi:ribonuclease E
MRTAASSGLSALRMIEDEAARGRGDQIQLRAGREAAIYLLNKTRSELGELEQRYGVHVEVLIDESLEGARMSVESSGGRPVAQPRPQIASPVDEEEEDAPLDLAPDADDDEPEDRADEGEQDDRGERSERPDRGEGDRNGRRRRRRRRGGRGRSRREGEEGGDRLVDVDQPRTQPEDTPESETHPVEAAPLEEEPDSKPKRRRRRGGKVAEEATASSAEPPLDVAIDRSPMVDRPLAEEPPIAEVEAAEEAKPRARRRPRARSKADAEATVEATPVGVASIDPSPAEEPSPGPEVAASEPAQVPPARKPRARRSKKAEEAIPDTEVPAATQAAAVPAADNDAASEPETTGEPRRGWWQRTFG